MVRALQGDGAAFRAGRLRTRTQIPVLEGRYRGRTGTLGALPDPQHSHSDGVQERRYCRTTGRCDGFRELAELAATGGFLTYPPLLPPRLWRGGRKTRGERSPLPIIF